MMAPRRIEELDLRRPLVDALAYRTPTQMEQLLHAYQQFQQRQGMFADPNYYATGATSATIAAEWYPLNQTATSATTVAYEWTGEAHDSAGTWRAAPQYWAGPLEVDAEELARRERRALVAEVRRRRAHKKGRRLLLSVLDDIQQRQYARSGQFRVQASNGQWFVVQKHGRVKELDAVGRVAAHHCIHLPFKYVEEDNAVALKLMLETDVIEFFRIANCTPVPEPSRQIWTPPGAALAA